MTHRLYRYDLSPEQWIIVFVFISSVAVVLLLAIFVRNVLRWKVIRGLKDGIFYSNRYYLNNLSKSARKLILTEAERERQLRVVPQVAADFGWGSPGTELEGVHFKTSIAKSYKVIEEAAKARIPSLELKLGKTVSNYISEIQEYFPTLPTNTCEQYIDFYERACFTKEQFTAAEYRRFVNTVLLLIQHIEHDPCVG
ncbi:hypothetical protein Gasu2_70550 [Galdieria sulphuraria]|uniref:Defect at low temperature protein 1 n=1 Tax=Galdieria sulphuraria TaxID=130081 RepID=M2Y3F7_GALSU|nr:uncharacterized protein Gasu_22480 [Galdieria sulphuraria]EME30339.1 hypothetical protein Gasu_22480 [Galdieria sulphuraria]GJD12999.1 hypothetical protein Gasu2_70550 [Galdieria sulphuraria]|eukprot:XP_005706859.1 hypothetical protein Gasu_22480 [Galdieria sulphuraria]